MRRLCNKENDEDEKAGTRTMVARGQRREVGGRGMRKRATSKGDTISKGKDEVQKVKDQNAVRHMRR